MFRPFFCIKDGKLYNSLQRVEALPEDMSTRCLELVDIPHKNTYLQARRKRFEEIENLEKIICVLYSAIHGTKKPAPDDPKSHQVFYRLVVNARMKNSVQKLQEYLDHHIRRRETVILESTVDSIILQ